MMDLSDECFGVFFFVRGDEWMGKMGQKPKLGQK